MNSFYDMVHYVNPCVVIVLRSSENSRLKRLSSDNASSSCVEGRFRRDVLGSFDTWMSIAMPPATTKLLSCVTYIRNYLAIRICLQRRVFICALLEDLFSSASRAGSGV